MRINDSEYSNFCSNQETEEVGNDDESEFLDGNDLDDLITETDPLVLNQEGRSIPRRPEV